jgi:hypothetical protein
MAIRNNQGESEYRYVWSIIPDDPEENKIWRKKTLDYCSRDSEDAAKLRRMIYEACRKDFWFWAKGFAYCHEVRMLDDDMSLDDLDTKVPFLPWPHQIPVVDHILKVMGKKDVRLLKSRAQGASWLMILIATWLWLFRRGAKVNFVSKDEKAVDEKGNMDSLFAKIDWLLSVLPPWMVGQQKKDWNRSHGDHTFTRTDGETAITGYACTANVATGGRSTVFFMDEHGKHPRPQDQDAMASTQPITRCRVCLSTPWGKGGAFYEMVKDTTITEPVLIMAWWDNPTQNRGLYRVKRGKPVAVDVKKYGPLPEEYTDPESWEKIKARLKERGYDLSSDKVRSPWYDQECLRQGANPVLIAQEYDMEFSVEGAQYYAESLINRLLENSRPSDQVGEFSVDPEALTGKWSDNPDGRFKLWCDLDITSSPQFGDYIVSADVASGIGGEGSSNSAITIFNRKLGVKVGSFASPKIEPYLLAELCIALCRWFVDYKSGPAFLIWEANGHGAEFTQRVERSDFRNFYRRIPKDAPRHTQQTNKAGYWTWKRSVLLGPYREALLEGRFDNPDAESIKELAEYQMGLDGEPYNTHAESKSDPAGAKAAHGDRVISDALAWEAALHFGDQREKFGKTSGITVNNVRVEDVPLRSFAGRRARYLRNAAKMPEEDAW